MFDYLQHAIWPLVFLLAVLFGFNRMKETLEPIVKAMVSAIALQAQQQAGKWMIASMFGLSASLAAFYDVFSQVGTTEYAGMSVWQLLALWAKVLNPFIVAALASALPPVSPKVNPTP